MNTLLEINDIETYIDRINGDYVYGNVTEHSYRGALEELLNKRLKDKTKYRNGIHITNEAKRKEYGAPDFEISRNKIPISFLETKLPGNTDLKGQKANKKQFDRYKKAINTIAFTDYCTFILYENGKETLSATIGIIEEKQIVYVNDSQQISNFVKILDKLADAEPQEIRRASVLIKLMAAKTKAISSVLENAMIIKETKEDRGLIDKMEALRKFLVHDMNANQFVDFYAQTIVYGLFIARLHENDATKFTMQRAADLIPTINPFLKDIFKHLALAELHSRIRWVTDDLVSIFRNTDIQKVMRNYGKDPLVDFYEEFLYAYNPQIRQQYGVWYTPEEVVRFIVNSVDAILKDKLNIEKGLANNDTITYNDKQYHQVQILDPATGTGTFLAVTAKKIYESYIEKPWAWPEDVVKKIIPRLNGFEYLMAPYTMAHMKVGKSLLLNEIGDKQPDRLQIFLTNSLETFSSEQSLPFAKYITDESNAASSIKRDTPVMVVMGNPPYNEKSANDGEWINDLMNDYKQEPGMVREQIRYSRKKGKYIYKNTLKEPNPKGIDNDYCKFIRLGQSYVEKNEKGILAYICANTFLDTTLFRGMRYVLLKNFDEIYILNLHGSLKRHENKTGRKDQNIFNIKVGVSINIFIKKENSNHSSLARVYYKDIYGSKDEKLKYLTSTKFDDIDFVEVSPSAPLYIYGLRNINVREQYDRGFNICDLMPIKNQGFKTDRDHIARQYESEGIIQICEDMLSGKNDEELRDKYGFKDNRDWSLQKGRKRLKSLKNWQEYVTPILFHPFDIQWTLLHNSLITSPRPLLQKSVLNKDNIVLCLGKEGKHVGDTNWSLVFISTLPTDINAIPRGGVYLFPLVVYDKIGSPHINLSKQIIGKIRQLTGLSIQTQGDERKDGAFLAVELLDYVYAVLHSNRYREFYHECLQDGFPTIPYPQSADYFFAMADLGRKIRKLHILESVESDPNIASLKGSVQFNNICSLHNFEKTNESYGKVWINAGQFFDIIPIAVWNLEIAGFNSLDKWLQERKEKRLTNHEIEHFQKMVNALHQQIAVMADIDKIIQL